ncbi:MAG: PQQ-binding-like beta-propeller repeat protein, partial [Verrucomicrobiota bacterium]
MISRRNLIFKVAPATLAAGSLGSLEAKGAEATLSPWPYGKSSTSEDTVLMFRGNPSHTFYGTGPIANRYKVLWKKKLASYSVGGTRWAGTGWTGTAVKLGDYVYVGSVGRKVYCFDAMTGEEVWTHSGGRMFKSSLCAYDNKLYIGNVDDYLRCIDAASGELVWRYDTGRDLDSSPCVVDDKLYIAGENGYARCFNPHTGEQLWKEFLGGIGSGTPPGSNGSETSPAVVDGEFYAATYDGNLFCLDAETGERKWKTKTHGDTDASPVVSGDFVYAAAEEDSPHLFCFARENGEEVWRYSDNTRGYWSTPAVYKNRVYIGGADMNLHCVDAKSGEAIWKFETGDDVWSSPCPIDGKVVFGGRDEKLYIVDAKSGEGIFELEVSGRIISSPCVVDGHIWVGTAT